MLSHRFRPVKLLVSTFISNYQLFRQIEDKNPGKFDLKFGLMTADNVFHSHCKIANGGSELPPWTASQLDAAGFLKLARQELLAHSLKEFIEGNG